MEIVLNFPFKMVCSRVPFNLVTSSRSIRQVLQLVFMCFHQQHSASVDNNVVDVRAVSLIIHSYIRWLCELGHPYIEIFHCSKLIYATTLKLLVASSK